MELSKNFQHNEAEQQWYEHWNKQGYFHSKPDGRPAYTIVMPPPNVTGVLHMGHALNNTVQDILIRRAKMQGFNSCWVPGTDHASIATEAKVVGMLRDQGIDKKTLSRDEFLKYAWQWKEKYGGIILQQLKKLGCALDWDRTTFTMDTNYYSAVIRVFNELYEKGYIYRGVKMINWDPKAKTALSDEEVIFKQSNSKLYYVQYKLEGDADEYITIATVRPETILGDTAICVHPEDPRYAHLKGKHCFVPLINRRIPIIFDDYIDIEFGTGALKVTPAHDLNDYNLGQKHNLPVVDTLNDDGTMSEAAQLYIGMDRFAVRKKIVEDLRESGNLVKEEEYTNQVGYSERTDVVIEPRLSMQWWCNMQELAKPALAAVEEDEVEFHPAKFKNLYRHWMSNIKDWCISRQLWWGQRIPAWYDAENTIYVAETEAQALEQYKAKKPELAAANPTLRQDEDVLDTWFSSWLWPMEVFDWNASPDNKELEYYYPTNTLVTAPEIIFFWVARMIMAGYEFKGKKPFDKVYFTGIVRDKKGRKMSKSLGNSPDLLQLIEENGADAIRFSVMISSPAGNDLLFDEGQIDQGKFFINKMWNAMKLVKGWEGYITPSIDPHVADLYSSLPPHMSFAINWMENRIAEVSNELEGVMKDFRLSEGLKTLYSLIWNDFCSWYLEWVKPPQDENDRDTSVITSIYHKTIGIYEQLLKLLHPYLPFVTEEIYHKLRKREFGDDLINQKLGAIFNRKWEINHQNDLITSLISSLGRNNKKSERISRVNQLGHEFISFVKKARFIEDFSLFQELLVDKNVDLLVNTRDRSQIQRLQNASLENLYNSNFLIRKKMVNNLGFEISTFLKSSNIPAYDIAKQLLRLRNDSVHENTNTITESILIKDLNQIVQNSKIKKIEKAFKITEYLYRILEECKHDSSIYNESVNNIKANKYIVNHGQKLQEVITAIRDARNKNQLKPKETVKLYIDTQSKDFYESVSEILKRQVNAESLGFTTEAKQGSLSIVVQTDKIYVEADMPAVDPGVQKDQMQKDLDYLKGFLVSIDKKLGNERFVQNAKPEVLEGERKKQADALAKIKAIEESLSLL